MVAPNASAKVPDIRTELPGPNSRRLIERDERFTSSSYTRFYPLTVRRGQGTVIEDMDGNRFLDFTAGIAVCATGHCHPRVVKAIQQQAAQLIHMSGTDFYYPQQADLAEKLAQLAPGSARKRVFFTNSGAEAVEAAFKLARFHTKRQRVLAFYGAFHGRTLGALSLTASKVIQRRGFGPLVPGVTHVDFPNPYRCTHASCRGNCTQHCLEAIEDKLFRKTIPPDEIAAVFVEPIQGEGGYLVPPPDFHRELKALCAKNGILYVADEVQSGMGRTGKMFASEHWGVEPDIICTAKGIASGMPLGAIIASESVMNWPPGAHASTFGGNPVACAAALETIALIEEELMENAARMEGYLLPRLCELQQRHRCIGDVRGKGLMLAVELVEDRATKKPAPRKRDEVVLACFRKGLLLLGCGENSLRLSPPLIITDEHATTAIRILDEALSDVEDGLSRDDVAVRSIQKYGAPV